MKGENSGGAKIENFMLVKFKLLLESLKVKIKTPEWRRTVIVN